MVTDVRQNSPALCCSPDSPSQTGLHFVQLGVAGIQTEDPFLTPIGYVIPFPLPTPWSCSSPSDVLHKTSVGAIKAALAAGFQNPELSLPSQRSKLRPLALQTRTQMIESVSHREGISSHTNMNPSIWL